LNEKVKTAVAQELENVNSLLAEKDAEIKVLKDMIRST
jgi:hypothetical protein